MGACLPLRCPATDFLISMLLLSADRIEKTVSLLLLPVFVFTKLLPGNALIKSVTLCIGLNSTLFWDVTPYIPVDVQPMFRRKSSLSVFRVET
jgi:hypothetical protein